MNFFSDWYGMLYPKLSYKSHIYQNVWLAFGYCWQQCHSRDCLTSRQTSLVDGISEIIYKKVGVKEEVFPIIHIEESENFFI